MSINLANYYTLDLKLVCILNIELKLSIKGMIRCPAADKF